MIISHVEKNQYPFEGTIIDLETIGSFCRGYYDSRCYQKIIPTIFGYINKDSLNIFCAKTKESLDILKEKIAEIVPQLEAPFYAYNCSFERGVLFHYCGLDLNFDGDLMKKKVPGIKWERKEEAVVNLKIPKHGDPFHGDGYKCMLAWQNGDLDSAIKHNRSCLLKERDILLRRGHRSPEHLHLFGV